MSGGFYNYFSGQAVKPAQVQYEALTIPPSLTLVWPTESIEGANYVAAWMDVDATAGGNSLTMPDATQGSTGVASIINNVGADTFTVLDNTGTLIATIAAGLSWVVILKDNTTQAGSWEAVQLGATTSNAQASALAGLGLQAVLTQLVVAFGTVYLNANSPLTPAYRASGVVWQGAGGTLQLNAIATLTAGWWCLVTNEGTEPLTVSTSGADTINAAANFVIPANPGGPPYSTLIIASSTGFNTFAGTPSVIPISGGGTGATTAGQALTNLGGTTIGVDIFEAPTAAAILELLGIGPSAFQESTIAGNQVLTESSINTAFVCTAALSLALPDSTTLTKSFLFAVSAQGGAVTLAPGTGADKINGGTAGANFIIPQGASALVVTDADDNWWLFFLGYPGTPWVAAAGTADAITVANTVPVLSLIDGQIQAVRHTAANTSTTPTLKQDASPAYTITKLGGGLLAVGDIPGVNYEAFYRYNLANTRWEMLNPATPWLDYYSITQGAMLYRGKYTDISTPGTWMPLAPPADTGYLLQYYIDSSDSTVQYPRWVSYAPSLYRKTFAANTSFTFPDGITTSTAFRIYGLGGGGGGGAGTAGGNGNAGGGGGSGGYGDVLLSGFTAGQVATITVGNGGTGGSGSVGANGDSSIFAYASLNVMTLSGGSGGGLGSATVVGAGGAAGGVTLSTSGLTLIDSITQGASPGGGGAYLGNSISIGGAGGSNPLGKGGAISIAGSNGNVATGAAGSGYGAGGAGGAESGATATIGGAGTNGVIILEWAQ
jgi:hypothetical protein